MPVALLLPLLRYEYDDDDNSHQRHTSLRYKFYVATVLELRALCEADASLPAAPALAAEEVSAARTFVTEDKPLSRGEQEIGAQCAGKARPDDAGDDGTRQTPPPSEAAKAAFAAAEAAAKLPQQVGASVKHKTADLQVTGEAVYTDDILDQAGQLHAALVMATVAKGTIDSVDTAKALAVPGVEVRAAPLRPAPYQPAPPHLPRPTLHPSPSSPPPQIPVRPPRQRPQRQQQARSHHHG